MMSKSIVWTLFNIKYERREGENEREKKKRQGEKESDGETD